MKLKKPDPTRSSNGYFAWSRDPAVGLFAVLPLWIAYEFLRLLLTPAERNLSEWFLLDAFRRLGPTIGLVLRVAFAVGVFVAMRSVVRRQIPWLRVSLVLVLEGTVYGLLLGPLAGALAEPAMRLLGTVPQSGRLLEDLVASLGAGIFEELLFRLGLMSLLFWIWMRTAVPLGLPRALGGVLAVLVSAALFSWHHHLREPFETPVFLFRAMAGVILGFLFWIRGFGVCVYTHAMYDVYYFLNQPQS
ncbi:MAG: CPBP family intramembrane glutamic endopeptidase [Planctomycetota bacterium]|nr:CPBP family intramembrane glutamic endopeptidase [Planctomycetota bacterium]